METADFSPTDRTYQGLTDFYWSDTVTVYETPAWDQYDVDPYAKVLRELPLNTPFRVTPGASHIKNGDPVQACMGSPLYAPYGGRSREQSIT